MSNNETNSTIENGQSVVERSDTSSSSSDVDTLVVVSKIKKAIKAKSGFNTGQCCIDALTRKVVEEINKGIDNARSAGRKTVMGRDIL